MHFNGQRQMVREMRPRFVAEDLRVVATGIAQINPIQSQQREPRGVGLGRAAVMAFEGFVQVVAAGEGDVALQLLVIEVAGDDHRRIVGQRFEQLAEQLQLQLPMAFEQAQVHADGMHFGMPRHIQYAM